VTHGLDGLWCGWFATCNGIDPAAPIIAPNWGANVILVTVKGNIFFLNSAAKLITKMKMKISFTDSSFHFKHQFLVLSA